MALVASLVFLSTAAASLSPRKQDPLGLDGPLSREFVKKTAEPAEEQDELVITGKTTILLDGRSCTYAEVPEGAEIIRLELAADKKTVLAIHFRSKK
jgi:hypothetical protein